MAEIGKTYLVDHQRKGQFSIKVESQSDIWINGTIIAGTTKAMLSDNVREKGEKITIKKSLCTLIEQS